MTNKSGKQLDDVWFRVLIRPFDEYPLQIVVRMDYLTTGDIIMTPMNRKECDEVSQLLNFVYNYVGDVAWEIEKWEADHPEETKNIIRRS